MLTSASYSCLSTSPSLISSSCCIHSQFMILNYLWQWEIWRTLLASASSTCFSRALAISMRDALVISPCRRVTSPRLWSERFCRARSYWSCSRMRSEWEVEGSPSLPSLTSVLSGSCRLTCPLFSAKERTCMWFQSLSITIAYLKSVTWPQRLSVMTQATYQCSVYSVWSAASQPIQPSAKCTWRSESRSTWKTILHSATCLHWVRRIWTRPLST